ncbi:60S ribosomal protein L22-like 1 isoform X2 [Acanthochromis polyacanthus]|uniref:60S ribosomal protein L22-like 1 isoform X2 n=1 Tax=Acanthochromis polyacanthus TaxID=80966 RepID=UPI0022345CE7|nr:60S ribosomal protein L22-like 1 isoform X2 [Acanthochromis polyacanthus]
MTVFGKGVPDATCYVTARHLRFSLSRPSSQHGADEAEEADCWQEVQKGSSMEVHSGPDPPCGGRHPGFCQLWPPSLAPQILGFSSLERHCAVSNRKPSSRRGSR